MNSTLKSPPRLEDGYVRIANELLDALISFDLGKREQKIVMFVIRKTYGYGKKKDDMTLTQIANATGLDLGHISRTVKQLASKKILLKQQGKYGFILGINKDYGQWTTLPNQQPLAKSASEPCQNGNLTLPKKQTQKKLPKDNFNREFILPDWVPQNEWKEFVDHRKLIKKPLSIHAMKLAIIELKKIVDAGHMPDVVINETILNGWNSFYPTKNKTNSSNNDLMVGVL